MPFHDAGALRYYSFDSLAAQPLTHAIFTRRGGVSLGDYAELNVGGTVGDEPQHVKENLLRVFAAVERPRESIFDSWLIHGTHALVAKAARPAEWARPPQADIVMTDRTEVTLFMRYADCTPIVLYDPVKKAVALAHAGWRGAVQRVAAVAVERMSAEYGSQAGDVLACIGPAISAAKYEVGQDVVEQVQATFGDKAESLLPKRDGHVHFDLVAANRLTLQEAGVRDIESADLCTASDTENWFSHRASGGHTGRFGTLIALGS
jgi:YfiH family protein